MKSAITKGDATPFVLAPRAGPVAYQSTPGSSSFGTHACTEAGKETTGDAERVQLAHALETPVQVI